MGWIDWLLGKDDQQESPDAARTRRRAAREETRLNRRIEKLNAGTYMDEATRPGGTKNGAVLRTLGTMQAAGLTPQRNAEMINANRQARAGDIPGALWSETKAAIPALSLGQSVLEAAAKKVAPESALASLDQQRAEKGLLSAGEQTAAAIRGDVPESTGDKLVESYGVENRAAQLAGGLVWDIGTDWTTYASGGHAAETKAGRAKQLLRYSTELEDGRKILDAAKMAEDGFDLAGTLHRYGGADAVKALENGALSVTDIPAGAQKEIDKFFLSQAGKQMEGTARRVNAPILRRGEQTGKIGAEVIYPGVERLSPEVVAQRFPATDKTITARIARKTGSIPTLRSRIFGLGDEVAGQVGMDVGTRSADKGGIKFLGQTIADIQPQMYDAAYAAKQSIRSIPGATAVEGLFNPLADVAQEGKVLNTLAADAARENLILGLNIAKNTAVGTGEELASAIADPMERHLASFAENEAVAEALPLSDEFRAGERRAKASAISAQRRAKALAGVDVADDQAVAEKRAILDGKAAPIRERLAAIADERARIEEARVAAQEASGARTSYSAARGAGEARGRAAGAKQTARELDLEAKRLDRDAQRLTSRLGNIEDQIADFDAGVAERRGVESLAGAGPRTRNLDRLANKADAEAAAQRERLYAAEDAYSRAGESVPTLDTPLPTDPEMLADFNRAAEAITVDDAMARGRAASDQATQARAEAEALRDRVRSELSAPEDAPRYAANRKYRTWRSSVGDELLGTGDIEQVEGVTRTRSTGLSESGRKFETRVVSDRVDDFAESRPDIVLDILEGRVNAALDAGDLEAARHHEALLKQFVEERSADRSAHIPDFMRSQFDREGSALPRDPEYRVSGVDEAAARYKSVSSRIDEAYKSGRADSRRVEANRAAQDIIRAERRAARLEGRAIDYNNVLDEMTTDAEKMQAAALIMRDVEKRSNTLTVQEKLLARRLREAQSQQDKFESLVSKYRSGKMTEQFLKEQGRIFRENAVDYDRAEQFLVKQGVAPERASEIRGILEARRAEKESMLAEMKAAGLAGNDRVPIEKMGEGFGSAGYIIGTDPEKRGFLDTMANGQMPSKERTTRELAQGQVLFGIDPERGPELLASLRDHMGKPGALMEEWGKGRSLADLDEVSKMLDFEEWRNGLEYAKSDEKLLAAVKSRKDVPQQPKAATYRTLKDRLTTGNLQTQTDYALAEAAKVQADLSNLAKAKLQDEIVGWFGTPHNPKAPAPAGQAVYTITRDGKRSAYLIPQEVENLVATMDSMFIADEATHQLLRGIDKTVNLWKRLKTSWNPAFHGRNALTNLVLAHAENLGDPKGFEQATAIMLTPDAAERVFNIGGRKMTGAEIRQFALENNILKGEFGPGEAMNTVRDLVRQKSSNNLVSLDRWGGEAGRQIEDTSRLGVFINALDKGLDPSAAERMVTRTLYDYSATALTPFGRNVAKRVIPFYGWLSQNIPHMLSLVVKQPGKLTAYKHLRDVLYSTSDINAETMPEYYRDTMALPIPGTNVMYASPSPLQDLDRLDVMRPGKTARGWLASTAPWLKLSFEMGGNTDLFTGKQIDNPYTNYDTIAPGYIPDGMAGVFPGMFDVQQNPYTGAEELRMNGYAAKMLRELTPSGLGAAGAAMDTRGNPRAEWLAVMTGQKFVPIDQQAWDDEAQRERIARLRIIQRDAAR